MSTSDGEVMVNWQLFPGLSSQKYTLYLLYNDFETNFKKLILITFVGTDEGVYVILCVGETQSTQRKPVQFDDHRTI